MSLMWRVLKQKNQKMKARIEIEFDPDNKEDAQKISNVLKAEDWKFLVWDLDQHLREQVKYRDKYEHPADELAKIRDWIREELQSRNLSIEE